MSSSDNSDEAKLHKYVNEGRKIKLKTFLKNVPVNVDSMDTNGNTPLYNACVNQKKGIVRLLLEKGANPNERCHNGETPVHVAAAKSNIKIMFMLIQFGGDLRLHDNQGRTPKSVAHQQQNPALRRKMLAFIEEARSNARIQALSSSNGTGASFLNICPIPNDDRVNPCGAGFGVLYKSPKELGVTMLVPQISESDITHDHTGPTHNNGAFMIYESMRWRETHPVTIKRLHSSLIDSGQVDLLIEELRFLRRVNHFPHVLALMGICPSDNAESIMLMFERVQVGSLFNILHEITLSKRPKLKSICEIALSVCDALVYLHERGIYHCFVSSHSIILTTLHTAKLANLEYAVERSTDPNKQKKSKIVNNHYVNCAYNWLAPELMADQPPNEFTDMYGFCVVIWELFNMRIPWKDMEWNQIKFETINRQNQLSVDFNLIPLPFSRILKDGFAFSPISRMTLEDVKPLLDDYHNSIADLRPTLDKSMKAAATAAVSGSRQDQDERRPKVAGHRRRSRESTSFSEGIASLNDALNSAATLNSLEDEFDKISDPSTNSYIYCDAYKAEFYLTQHPDLARHRSRQKSGSSVVKRENSLDSKLKRNDYINGKHVVGGHPDSKHLKVNRQPSTKLKPKEGIEHRTAPLASSTTTLQSPSPPPVVPSSGSPHAKKVHKHPSNVSKHTITSSSTSHQFQQLPPTPPLPNNQLTSTRIQHQTSVNPNQTLPSFLITPSPTPVTISHSSTTKSKLGLNLSLNKSSVTFPADTSTPTLKNSSGRTLNKLNQRGDEVDEETKQTDGELSIKTSTKLFEKEHQVNSPSANKTGRNLTYTIGNEMSSNKPEGSQLKEFGNITDNLVRPTPDEKRRSYFPKFLNVRGDQIDAASKQLSQKLDLSTISQEDNLAEKVPNQSRQKGEQTDSDPHRGTIRRGPVIQDSIINMPRSGSLTRLTNYFNQSASAMNQSTNNAQTTENQQSARASRSETSMKPRSASTASNRVATGAGEDERRVLEQALKPLNADEMYCGQGSVRNLVYSYEVFPLKERCDSDHKIRQIREEREREMQSMIEQKSATTSAVAAAIQLQHQQQLMALEEQQQQQQVDLARQQSVPNMRKELSTISERTEVSISPHPNLIAHQMAPNGKGVSTSGSSSSNINRLGNGASSGLGNLTIGVPTSPTQTTTNRPNSSSTPKQNSNLAATTSVSSSDKKMADFVGSTLHHGEMMTGNVRVEEVSPGEESDDEEDDDDDDDDEEDEHDYQNADEIILKRMRALQQIHAHHHKHTHQRPVPFLDSTSNNEKLVELSCGDRELTRISAINSMGKIAASNPNVVSDAKGRHGSTNNLSQDDCLSTIQVGEWSNDFSDGIVIANEFERMASKTCDSQSQHMGQGDADAQNHHRQQQAMVQTPSSQHRTQHQHQQSPPSTTTTMMTPRLDQTIRESRFETAGGGNSESRPSRKLNRPNDELLNDTSQFNPSHRRRHPLADPDIYRNFDFHVDSRHSTSPGMAIAASTVASFSDDKTGVGHSTNSANMSPTRRLANVKIDKHVIDTTKYKGYQYKLETKSNISNQYHIKGLLTNEQTGHSLLVTNTKVKTPKISTKVIIDQ